MSIMWSIGALLELPDRSKLEVHMRQRYKLLDFPPEESDAPGSMFDYLVDKNGMNSVLFQQ